MSDPFNDGGDTVGRDGGLDEGVDTGGINPGQTAGGAMWGQGDSTGTVETGGQRGNLPNDDDIDRQMEDIEETLEEAGVQRLTMEELAEQKAENEILQAEEDAYMEELARLEAEKDAAREEAHANGEAFKEGDTTWNGEAVEEWTLPDGTVILVNEAGEAVSVEWPPGEGPVYIGDVLVGGEPHAVYELPTGTQIVVNEDNETIGTLDEVDVDDTSVPMYWITGDKEDSGEMVTVEVIPDPDGSYDTLVVDAETGEVLKELDTGTTDTLGVEIYTQADVKWDENYSLYAPPGSDYYIVIDSNGVPVDTIPIPEEPEWSILGIVEYYEDGEVVVDLGATQVSVDVVGPDGGISVEMDLLFGEATAGVTWDEDGSWQFDASVDADVGIAEIEADLGVGQDADGMWHVDVETSLEMNVGLLSLEGGQHFHFQETPEGSEWNVGWEGKVSGYGVYVERAQDLTVVFDEDGATATYQDMIGAGVSGLGGFQLTNETQVQTDGTLRGTEATQGIYGRIVDKDGDEQIGGGTYYNSETGPMSRSEQLDTGRDYERQYDDDLPPGVNEDDHGALGEGEIDRFGLTLGDDSDGEDAEGRPRIARDVFDELSEDGPRRVERAWKGVADGPGDEVPADDVSEDGPRPVEGAWKATGERGVRDGMPEDGPRPVEGALKIGSAVDAGREGEDGPRRVEGAWKATGERGAVPDGAQTASNPPPPAEDDAESERPVLFPRRDDKPADEPTDEPADTPDTPTERPKLFPTRDGEPPEDDPVTPIDPTDLPPIHTERLMDSDEDGDGRPDRLGRDPILGDGDGGSPSDGPPVLQTDGAQLADAGTDQSADTLDRPAAESITLGFTEFDSTPPDVDQFGSSASGSPNIDRAPEPADGSGNVEQFGSTAGGSPNVDQFASSASGSPDVEQFSSSAGGSPNIDQAPEPTPQLPADDITAMPPSGAAADGASPAPEPLEAAADMQAVPDYSITGSDNQWQPEVLGDEPPAQTEPLIAADPRPDHAPVEPEPIEVAVAPEPLLSDPVGEAMAPEPIAEPVIELPEPPIEPDQGLDDDQA